MSDKYIWLINLGDEITWCNDPDPSDGIEDEDVTGYTRNDLVDEFKTRITELENALNEAADDISEASYSEWWDVDDIEKYRTIAKGEKE